MTAAPAPGSRAPSEPLRIPGVTIDIAGSTLDAVHTAVLGSLRVRREASAPAACELVFEDPEDAQRLERSLRLGAEVEVRVDGVAGSLFSGELLTVERVFAPDGTLQVTARCQDVAHRLRGDSRLRAFVDVSVAELVRELAGEVGLGVEADAEGPRLPRFVQDGRSSLEVLTSVTRAAGLWWQVIDGKVVLFGTEGIGREIEVEFGVDALEAVVTTSALANRGGWQLMGWDPVSGSVKTGSSGADAAAPGARQAVTGGRIAVDTDQLDALAGGLVADDASVARSLRAVVRGDASIAPGVRIVVRGLTSDASDPFLVLAADHVVDSFSGYLCTVTSEVPPHLRMRDPLERVPAREASSITLGEVLRIDDPEGRGRVRVALSAYDRIESEWLPVLALGAGEEKGLSLQPDVGDHVVVAHDARDPGRGVVLGGVRTTDGGEPSVGVVDGAVGVYGMRLPTGQSLRMAAAKDTVVVVNHGGSKIELSEAGVLVHAQGDLVLEAPGHLLRLRAERIELEQA